MSTLLLDTRVKSPGLARAAHTLLAASIVDPATGCWVWQRSTTCGYGRIRIDNQLMLTHRIAYRLWVGDLVDGMQIDHLCSIRACCNPAHLEQVTPIVNQHRASPLHSVCSRGHVFDDTNTGRLKSGTRYCRTCHNARNRASKRRTRQVAS
jgi:hypothetical protein